MAFKRVIIRRVGPLSWLLGAKMKILARTLILLVPVIAFCSEPEQLQNRTPIQCGTPMYPTWQMAKPNYPYKMQKKKIFGTVRSRISINADGVVQDVTIISSPHPEFSKSVTTAIKQWHFKPCKIPEGKSVFLVENTIVFNEWISYK